MFELLNVFFKKKNSFTVQFFNYGQKLDRHTVSPQRTWDMTRAGGSSNNDNAQNGDAENDSAGDGWVRFGGNRIYQARLVCTTAHGYSIKTDSEISIISVIL